MIFNICCDIFLYVTISLDYKDIATNNLLNYLFYPLASLVLATLIGGTIVRWLNSPRVIVRVKGDDSKFNNNKDGALTGFLSTINFINLGSTRAEQCIAYIVVDDNTPILKDNIMEVSEACFEEYLPKYEHEKIALISPRTQWITPSDHLPPKRLELSWNHSGDPYMININPGVIVSLNIVRFRYHEEENRWYIIFPSEKGWRSVRLRIWYQSFKGIIIICPANSHPLILHFEVTIDQDSGIPRLIASHKKLTAYSRKKILESY